MFIEPLTEEAKSMEPHYEGAMHAWIRGTRNVVELGESRKMWDITYLRQEVDSRIACLNSR